MNARTTQLLIGAIAAIAIFGGGYAVGRTLAPAPAADTAATNSAAGGNAAAQAARRAAGGATGGGQGGFAAQGQATVGRVLSVNDGSITIEARQQGAAGASPAVSSTIALIGTDTRLLRTVEQEIKLADLKAGDQVTIVGTTDATTGTVSASAVLVGGNALQQVFGGQRPGAAGGGHAPGASPSPSPR